MFSSLLVCLLVCLFGCVSEDKIAEKTCEWIFMKISGSVGHNARNNLENWGGGGVRFNPMCTVFFFTKLSAVEVCAFGVLLVCCHVSTDFGDIKSFFACHCRNPICIIKCTPLAPLGPLLLTWLNLIPAWISNYIHYEMMDEITYPFPIFMWLLIQARIWINPC